MKKTLLASFLLSFCCSLSFAAEVDTQPIKDLVEKKLGFQADSVQKLPSGLYEIVVGRQVLYVDEQVRSVFTGNIYDIETRQNLTQNRIDELSRINIKDLPLKQAIRSTKGKGQRTLYVFSDPECHYCQRLEKTLQQIDNVTVYTFITPLMDSEKTANKILCSKNPAQTWHNWMVDQKELTHDGNCNTLVAQQNLELAEQLDISRIPTIFFANGLRVERSISAKDIEAQLESITTK